MDGTQSYKNDISSTILRVSVSFLYTDGFATINLVETKYFNNNGAEIFRSTRLFAKAASHIYCFVAGRAKHFYVGRRVYIINK